MVAQANIILSSLTVLAQVISLLFIIFFFLRNRADFGIWQFLAKNGMWIAFIAGLISLLGSLFYSEIAGYAPCTLCWYQRILMYPQVILLGLALWKKDKAIIPYSLALSIPGAILAFYHYTLQVGISSGVPCSAVGYSAACSQRFFMNFGYITIPMMAFAAFLLMVLSLLALRLYNRES